MGISVSLDAVVRKVNALPLEVASLNRDHVKTLFGGKWSDALQDRFKAAQQNGTVTRSVLVQQLLRQKDMDDDVERPARTLGLAVMRRRNAKAAAVPTENEMRIGPDGEPHILMDFLNFMGDQIGRQAWQKAQRYVPPPPKVKELAPIERYMHEGVPKSSHTRWQHVDVNTSNLAAYDDLAKDNQLLELLVRDGGATI